MWYLPEDLKRFKRLTNGNIIVMGRKTFESMGSKLLPGRLNIILTTQQGLKIEGAEVVNTMEQAIDLANKKDYKELMVIGGGQVYEIALLAAA